jgi:redox-sensitive bicupin YhaK (pirin superfamily)
VQLWVNLPARDKMAPPGYQGITAAQIPTLPLLDLNGADAGTVRPIAGTFDGTSGPANTFTPMQVWDVQLKAGHTITLPAPEGHTTVPLVYQGRVKTADGQEAGDAEMIVYTRDGEGVQLTALADTTLLWLCGEPIDEPVVGYGPFVMNTPQEIQQAFVDFQSGRMGRL